jgi:hypothetical protein
VTGADRPFADLRRYHGVPMEGWFWRFTDAAAGVVVIVLCSVNRDREGRTWGMTAVAIYPGGLVAEAVTETAIASTAGPGLGLGQNPTVLLAEEDLLRVTIGMECFVDVRIEEPVGWPRRLMGGVGLGHFVPWLGQYWHPHVLGGRARGTARIGDTTVSLDGAQVYAEKNWGRGFPGHWWWGQAQGFDERDDACVAFAGGPLGPLEAGALAVRLGDDLIHVVRPPMPLRTTGVRPPSHPAGVRPPWSLRARSARHVVDVEVSTHDEPLRLPVPVPRERGVVHGPSAQHLAADLRLRVVRGGREVFSGTSHLAGFELGAPARRNGAR